MSSGKFWKHREKYKVKYTEMRLTACEITTVGPIVFVLVLPSFLPPSERLIMPTVLSKPQWLISHSHQ